MKNDWMFKIFPWFFGFVFFLIISIIGLQAYVAYITVDAVQKDGIRGVAGQLWCGSKNQEECTQAIQKALKEGLQ